MKLLVKMQVNMEVDVLPGTVIAKEVDKVIKGMVNNSVPHHIVDIRVTPQPTNELAAAEALRKP